MREWADLSDRDRDAWLHARVLGVEVTWPAGFRMPTPVYDGDKIVPRYTTDIAAAMGLLEGMYSRHEWCWSICPYNEPWKHTRPEYVCSMWDKDGELNAKAGALPAAIAEACYKALGGDRINPDLFPADADEETKMMWRARNGLPV